jgi:hypothetical protein
MKTLTLSKNEESDSGGIQPTAGVAMVEALSEDHPELPYVVKWMEENDCDPRPRIQAALAKLHERKNFLPKVRRKAYAKKLLLSEFLYRWALKHRGKSTVKELQENEATNEREVKPVQFAMMLVGDARTFVKNLPRLAKVRAVSRYGRELGNAEDFSCFVLDHSCVLAHRFLSNFDTGVKNAHTKAVNYLGITAVSHYLRRGAHAERDDAGITKHLRESQRLCERTRLAAKLAYLPVSLTEEERQVLRREYGLQGTLARRMKIKDIAKLFGYPTAQTLSRKLYRLKGWVKNEQRKRFRKEVTP